MNDSLKIPQGHHAINSFFIIRDDAMKFIEFTQNVFDARERREVRTPDRDGKLIHAEIQIGDATIMLADAKADWPFTPAFMQIYVADIDKTIARATRNGAVIVTEKSPFYGGFNIARIRDPFGNIWWLYEPAIPGDNSRYDQSDTSWHNREPSYIYTTLIEEIKRLK
jgi:uncharacterized glyoxalase superfamily protein PhnB